MMRCRASALEYTSVSLDSDWGWLFAKFNWQAPIEVPPHTHCTRTHTDTTIHSYNSGYAMVADWSPHIVPWGRDKCGVDKWRWRRAENNLRWKIKKKEVFFNFNILSFEHLSWVMIEASLLEILRHLLWSFVFDSQRIHIFHQSYEFCC